MSYNSHLTIYCGNINSLNNESKVGDISENRCESNDIDRHHHNNSIQANLIHNGNSIWTNFQTGKLILVCLKAETHSITFIPSLKIIKQKIYTWTLDDFHQFQKDLMTCPTNSLISLIIMDLYQGLIPNYFFFYLKNKLSGTLLSPDHRDHRDHRINQKGYWILLLYRPKISENTLSTPPTHYISSQIFKNNSQWVNLYGSIKNTLPIVDQTNWDVKFQNSKTWINLGETFSIDRAKITFNLKKLPYILQKHTIKK